MDIMTLLSNTIELLKFAFNLGEFLDIVFGSLKEHYPFLFKQEESEEADVTE